jgi:hypothetical protein
MAVVPAGQAPDREYHRLQPVASDPEARTEAERLESLRKVACASGADAVIEAVNEEIRQENGNWATVASGTAVTWVLRGGGAKPISGYPTHAKPPAPAGEPPPEQPPAEQPPPEAQPTATAATTGKTGPAAPPTASAKPTPPPAPTSSGKPSLLKKK